MSRWIDADALIAELQKWDWQDAYLPIHFKELLVDDAPSIDIVRCKECKYHGAFSTCTYWSADPYEQASVEVDDFCSYGEREGE